MVTLVFSSLRCLQATLRVYLQACVSVDNFPLSAELLLQPGGLLFSFPPSVSMGTLPERLLAGSISLAIQVTLLTRCPPDPNLDMQVWLCHQVRF